MAATQVPIGQLLVLREGCSSMAKSKHESPIVIRRASLLRDALDELIERREKEGAVNA